MRAPNHNRTTVGCWLQIPCRENLLYLIWAIKRRKVLRKRILKCWFGLPKSSFGSIGFWNARDCWSKSMTRARLLQRRFWKKLTKLETCEHCNNTTRINSQSKSSFGRRLFRHNDSKSGESGSSVSDQVALTGTSVLRSNARAPTRATFADHTGAWKVD